jgi:hypothetical protein
MVLLPVRKQFLLLQDLMVARDKWVNQDVMDFKVSREMMEHWDVQVYQDFQVQRVNQGLQADLG